RPAWLTALQRNRSAMDSNRPSLVTSPAWQALTRHYESMRGTSLRSLFACDPQRGERYAREAAGVYLDFSKNLCSDETLRLLSALAEQAGLGPRIAAMFRGDKINVTEGRAVLHVALRTPKDRSIVVDGVDVVPEVHRVLEQMGRFADAVRSGTFRGHTGKR